MKKVKLLFAVFLVAGQLLNITPARAVCRSWDALHRCYDECNRIFETPGLREACKTGCYIGCYFEGNA